MTPEQVRELEKLVEYGLAPECDRSWDALESLTDALLRHLGAPRVPTRISRERLAEIEAECKNGHVVFIDETNAVGREQIAASVPEYWWRAIMRWEDGRWHRLVCNHPTLRAALEAPVVRRAGCAPVQEFEVEA